MTDSVDILADMVAEAGWENLHPALRPWVEEETVLGPMVKHPFVFTIIGSDALFAGQANKMYQAKREIRRRYLDERNYSGYLAAHERPYRMTALEKLWRRNKIDLGELRELLAEFWIDTEIPEGNQAEPLHLFREAGFTTDDHETWGKLLAKSPHGYLTVYRGVDGTFELTRSGPSWTLNPEIATFFARRFDAKGKVWTYNAHHSEALAFFTGRGEEEVILDFDERSDHSRITLHKDYSNEED